MRQILKKVICNESGGEVLEYALIAGLVVIGAIAVIGAVGVSVVAKWTSVNTTLAK